MRSASASATRLFPEAVAPTSTMRFASSGRGAPFRRDAFLTAAKAAIQLFHRDPDIRRAPVGIAMREARGEQPVEQHAALDRTQGLAAANGGMAGEGFRDVLFGGIAALAQGIHRGEHG